jgi:ubiquinone/menaquinone biosynthesis C-methylase UbiE
MNFKEVRKVALKHAKKYPTTSYNITSNLNWLRYIKKILRIAQFLPKNGKILDAGCGIGHTTAIIKLARQDLEVVGLDIRKFSTWSEYRNFGVKFVRGNVEKLKFKECEFDAVISFGVMEHVNTNLFLKEIYRVLKPNSYNFIFDLPNKFSLSESFFARFLQKILKRKIFYHEKMYTKNEIKILLKKHGFKNIKIVREDLIPAQIYRISKSIGDFLNKNYILINKIDYFLMKTPLNFFTQTFSIECKKL